ncbi:MAG: hypothetical protein KKB31_05150, partial [Nanoarchaeota archaeon]|nr:hypothetical protein [Nanoarchaeota archaeon]
GILMHIEKAIKLKKILETIINEYSGKLTEKIQEAFNGKVYESEQFADFDLMESKIPELPKEENNNDEETIISYYNLLLRLQSNKETAITGYKIQKDFRDNLLKKWEQMTESYVKELGLNFFRELLDGVRFLIAHAYLNRFNRRIENGLLIPIKEDFEVAMKLMRQSISFKFRLIRSESFAKGLKDAKDYKKIMESDKIPEQVKEMIRGLVEVKGNAVIKR